MGYNITKDMLVKFLDNGLSSWQMAEQLGMSQTNVRYWLKKYGLNLPQRHGSGRKRHHCSVCGETDPQRFYGRKTQMCSKCDNQYTINRGRETKRRARELLGAKCLACGYDKYDVALDIHHLDPSQKDPTFNRMRGWKWERVGKELKSCVLLCKNCHAAVHAGLLTLKL